MEPTGTDGAAQVADAGTAEHSSPADGGSPRPLSTAECARLIHHVMALARPGHAETVEPEGVPTDEQVAAANAKLRAEQTQACIRTVTRPAFDCAMAAKTVASYKACAAP